MNIYFLVTNLPTIIAFSFANIHPFSHYSRKMAAIFILHGYLSIVFSLLTYSVLLSSFYASLLLLLFSPLSIIRLPLSFYLFRSSSFYLSRSLSFYHCFLSYSLFYPSFLILLFYHPLFRLSYHSSFFLSFFSPSVILSFLCLSYLFLSF